MLADSGATAMDIVLAVAVFSPFPILGVLCWVFWRAKKRDDAEQEALKGGG
jgi:hypothetical protein